MRSHICIRAEGYDFLGAGFLFAHDLVLTAAHCISGLDPNSVAVDIVVPEGDLKFTGTVRKDERSDLALIKLSGSVMLLKTLVPETKLSVGDADLWKIIPPQKTSFTTLTGSVADSSKNFTTVGGGDIDVLQLTCEQNLGDYRGYSGNPVHITAEPNMPVGGMVIEQCLDRENPDRAANILYAASMSQLASFSEIDVEILESLGISSDADRKATPAGPEDPKMDLLEKRLLRIQGWAADGIISPDDIPILRPLMYQVLLESKVPGDEYVE